MSHVHTQSYTKKSFLEEMVKRRRRGPKRRTFKRRRVSNAVRRYVQSKIKSNAETKRVNSNVVDLDISSTQSDIDILNLSKGTEYYERIGDKINVTGFYGKFQMIGGDATNVIRVILYIPRDPSLTLTGANTYGIIDPAVATILYDRLHTTTLNGPNTRIFTVAKKFRGKGMTVEWSGATIKKNRLRMLFVSDSGAVTHPTLSYHWVAYFKDS